MKRVVKILMSTRRISTFCQFIWDRLLFVVHLFNFSINAVILVIKSACKFIKMDPQRMSPVSAAKNFAQTITFKGSDTNYSVQIVAQDVTINCNTGSHNHGSSKVKLTNVVDYNWEQKYYTGHLLAVHVTGKYFAYGIKARNPTGKGGGMVRVATHDSSMRALIKEMSGQVQDIAFAHNYNTVILACVDEEGSLFVYNIEEKTDNLICTLLLHVVQTEIPMNSPSLPRVVWCPYLPEEDEADDDASKLLVLTHGNKAQLMNVAIINNKNGAGPLPISELTDGYLEINEHVQPIMDAAFSPDGTAVATASIDGYVKFFQIYMHEGTKPRCLHEWQPHDGKPLSCLSFLDNHNIYGADEQFWKFAITGCNNNTELKIWSCESWTCLQTLNFVSNPSLPSHEIFLKVRLDLSAGYLLLSDINNRVLYILEMHKDSNGSNAFARSISEFLLPASVLSFAILEASLRKFRCSSSTEDLYPCEENDDYEDGQNIVATVIRMYVIQPKRLQECRIVFQPDSFNKLTSVPSPLTSKNLIFPEGLSEIANDTRIDAVEVNQEISSTTSDTVVNPLTQLTSMLQNEMPKHYNELQNLLIQPSQPLNLMTPDAFSSPAKNDGSERNSSSQNSPTLIQMNSSPLPDQLGNKESSAIENNILNFQRTQKENFASGGSSPSREVQEILALNNTTYNTHEYYEDNKVTEEDVEVLTKKTDVFDQSDAYQTNTAVMYSEPSNLNADGWPSIPILKAKDVVKTEECRLSMQECNLNSTDALTEPMLSMNHKDNSSVVNNRSLQQWILTLMSMVREQNSQLVELQTEIKTLKLSQEKCNVPEDLENVIAKQLDLALARSHAQQIKLFENWASARMSKDRELHEALILNLSLAVSKQVHDKLQTAVNFEMTQTVLPHVIKTFENLKTLLLEDFSGKMARSDQMLKDNLNKFISSKAVVDSISASVANVVRPNMEKCYKEVISTTLLPSWDRVCNNMFQQLNDTFSAGTREYTQSLENHLERTQKRSMDKGREMVSQMQGLCDTMRGSADKLGNTLPNDLQKLFVTSFGSMQEKLLNGMNEMIREEVSAAFRSHASVLEDSVINAVRSRAVTPSPHDTQVQLVQIQQLLSQGHVNAAFQQALSAADLSLVVYICEKLNPQKLFSQSPCPIQPHVILSLIQQLSADMNNQTELKIQYLEEAVMNLDPSNPVTKEHITTVLRELLRQLAAFIAANPTNKNTRQIKMLQMAAHGLLIPK